jgi:hypothetical protein
MIARGARHQELPLFRREDSDHCFVRLRLIDLADPITYAVVPLLLSAFALAACALPAFRAANIEPSTAYAISEHTIGWPFVRSKYRKIKVLR